MPTAAPTKIEAKRRIAAIEKALRAGYPRAGRGNVRGAVNIAAAALKMPRQTLQSSLAIIEREHGLAPDWSLEQLPAEAGEVSPAAAIDKQRHHDRLQFLERENKGLRRQVIAEESLKTALFGLARTPVSPPAWTVARKLPGSAGMPVLLASDFQWGETVRPSELDGINAFSVAIAQRRYRLLIEKTIDLSFNHMTRPKYPGIVYLRGGDMVSGDIHQELRETNELSSIPAVKSLVESEAWGISQLADKFGRVHVRSVPGNHGRTTMKPQAKRFAESNYDTMSAWMLEQYFRSDPRVTFETPESGDLIFRIYGWTFLLTHGDRIGSRGGQGFIGPAATIARGMKKLIDYYASLGQTIDVILIGHFHSYMELEYGFCNGSLPGYSEYAKDNRLHPSAPLQLLFFVHPTYGVTARWPILLEHTPRRAAAVEDLSKFKAA